MLARGPDAPAAVADGAGKRPGSCRSRGATPMLSDRVRSGRSADDANVTTASTIDLTRARERLVELDDERAELCRTIASIEATTGGPDVTTAEGRVALFTSLFRGRPDVFATRWESTKSPGKTGWAPRCLNEWRPGVCEKPKVKCADCANRRFVAWSGVEARRHLEGRQTAGIYPLLADETCWLVAIDLDGPGWREDVGALRDSARELDIPVLVERSRSGSGAHLWVLFSRPVNARAARAVGTLLLTRAMRRRSISMASYDRLFPNQDTMPAGGFGNLIALPLQHARRAEGCTVFLGEDLEPCPDQWIYLAGVRRLDGEQAEQIAAEAERAGGTLGLPERTVTKTRARPRQLTPTPSSAIEICLTGRVEIPVAGVSPDLRDRLRRTAAFANPEFFERERARLSTHKTPRVIACHEDTGDRLLLPRGCLEAVVDEIEAAGASVTVRDERSDGAPIVGDVRRDPDIAAASGRQSDGSARERGPRGATRCRKDRDGDRAHRQARQINARAGAPSPAARAVDQPAGRVPGHLTRSDRIAGDDSGRQRRRRRDGPDAHPPRRRRPLALRPRHRRRVPSRPSLLGRALAA